MAGALVSLSCVAHVYESPYDPEIGDSTVRRWTVLPGTVCLVLSVRKVPKVHRYVECCILEPVTGHRGWIDEDALEGL